MFVAAVGRRELGKTTLVYARALETRRKLVVWDGKVATSEFRPAEGRVIYGGVAGVPLEEWPDSLAAAWQGAHQVVIQPPRKPSRADTWEWFTAELANHLERHPHDEWTLIVDEYGQVKRNWPMDDFDFLVKSVPRADVDIFVTAHKPVQIHPDARSNVDRWYIFQTIDPADLEMLKRRSVPPDVLAQLPMLAPHTFYEWDESRGRGRFLYDSAAWHVPMTPPVISADRRALFTLTRRANG